MPEQALGLVRMKNRSNSRSAKSATAALAIGFAIFVSWMMPAVAAAADFKRVPHLDLYGVNFPGMPIETGSADECAAQCTGDKRCAAYTFNAAHSACFLKASAEIAVSHPDATSGYRGGLEKRIRRLTMTIQEATDYPGNDIDWRKSTSFESCLLSCGKTRLCRAFTYVVGRQECWLKNRIGSAEPREGLVSGVK